MSDEKDRYLLIDYVTAASDLAESVTADVKSGKKTYSSETILKLSKFVLAADKFRHITVLVDAMKHEGKPTLN